MANAAQSKASPHVIGRYMVYRELASGGMASVWLARQRGDGGFSRIVAVKKLFPQYARDPGFVTMFRDEGRLAARIRHPNVVPTLDIVSADDELLLVMEYILGESLSKLLSAARQRSEPVDPAISVAVINGVLEGLHAAHQATNAQGVPLAIVHRDVSPQNVLVGADGAARVLDFGVAKAVGRLQETTQAGQLKGKLLYMPPEQMTAKAVDRRSDVWAASAVLWEMVAGRQLFPEAPDALRYHAGRDEILAPSALGAPAMLDEVLLRGLARNPDERFATARDMMVALEKVVTPAPARRVAQWVQKLASETLRHRAQLVEELEAEAARASMTARIASEPPASQVPPSIPAIDGTSPLIVQPTSSTVPPVSVRSNRRPWLLLLGLVPIVITALLGTFVVHRLRPAVSVPSASTSTSTTVSSEPAVPVIPPSAATTPPTVLTPTSSTAASTPEPSVSSSSSASTVRKPRPSPSTARPRPSGPSRTDPLDHDSRK